MLSKNVDKQLPTYSAQHPRGTKSSVTLLRKTYISHLGCYLTLDGTRVAQLGNDSRCAKVLMACHDTGTHYVP